MKEKEVIVERNKSFFDKHARDYEDSLFTSWLKRIQQTVAAHVQNRNATVLDVGCGPGYLLEVLAPEVREVVGVDVAPEMVAVARERVRERKNVQVLVAESESLPFKEGTFDAVVSTLMLHHVPDAAKAIGEMVRVTKVNGKIIIADAHIRPLWLVNLLFKLEPGFVKMYRKEEMERLFANAGCVIEKTAQIHGAALLVSARKVE